MTEKRWDGVMGELAQIPLITLRVARKLNGLTQRSLMSYEHWPETKAAEGKNATLLVKRDDGTWAPVAEVASMKMVTGIEPTAVYRDELHKWPGKASIYSQMLMNGVASVNQIRAAEGMNPIHSVEIPFTWKPIPYQGFRYRKAKRRLKKGDRKIAKALTSS